MKRILVLINIALVLIVAGCSKTRPPAEERPTEAIYFEKAWVDPQIVYSDSLYTLIVAGRIDSFVVDTPVVAQSPSIGFEVATAQCNVSVNLYDAYHTMIRPLLVRRLPPGFYKLTLSPATSEQLSLRPGPYILQADVCGRTEVAEVRLR